MTDLQYKILDIIFNYKGIAKVRYNNEVNGLDIDTITIDEFIFKIGKFRKNKHIRTLNKLLDDGFVQKVKILFNYEGYKLTDFGLKSYEIEKEKRMTTIKWYEKPMLIGIGSALVSSIATALLTFLLTNQSSQLEYKKLNEKLLYLDKRIDTLYPHPITNQKKN